MDVAVSHDGGIHHLTLAGEMDLFSANRVKEEATKLWEGGATRLLVDLSQLRYVDSSGIGALLYIFTAGSKRGCEIFFAGAHGPVLKVIELTKLAGFFPLVPNAAAARSQFSPPPAPTMAEDDPAEEIRQLVVDESSPLLDREGMYYKEFNIDLSHVRRLSSLIAEEAPDALRDENLLEQQISELIKNAVRHGNGNDRTKAIRIWFRFTETTAHVVIEDEGTGFRELETWNEFYREKIIHYRAGDFEKMLEFLSFRTGRSTDDDGGNALMAAVEYWNEGVVFNERRNTVAVKRSLR